ncbi:unnamed protein product [Polarella glacialis]|uniref:Uncharacterized protein n=1 Tax=Polarella glacialis TaxID=89957 RepID=A0A813I5Z2_POLGL|nr:unnamed protein product [Polarella glacialis]
MSDDVHITLCSRHQYHIRTARTRMRIATAVETTLHFEAVGTVHRAWFSGGNKPGPCLKLKNPAPLLFLQCADRPPTLFMCFSRQYVVRICRQ